MRGVFAVRRRPSGAVGIAVGLCRRFAPPARRPQCEGTHHKPRVALGARQVVLHGNRNFTHSRAFTPGVLKGVSFPGVLTQGTHFWVLLAQGLLQGTHFWVPLTQGVLQGTHFWVLLAQGVLQGTHPGFPGYSPPGFGWVAGLAFERDEESTVNAHPT